jgi:2-haloacid dehalogenase
MHASSPDGSPPVEAVVFDLGGVLIDWDPRYLYRKLFRDPAEMEQFLGAVCTQDWHEQHDRGRPMSETIPELTREYPEFAEYIASWARQDEMYGGAYIDTVEILEALRGRTRLLALTNWPRETFHLIRSRFEFLDWFEGIVVSGREGIAKPDPEIFELLAGRFSLVPTRTLFIDDSPRHLAAAANLGYQIHRFQGPSELKQRLDRAGLLP